MKNAVVDNTYGTIFIRLNEKCFAVYLFNHYWLEFLRVDLAENESESEAEMITAALIDALNHNSDY